MADEPEMETRADVARRRLAQLAASFNAELPPEESPPSTPERAPRVVVPAHLRVVAVGAVAACVLLTWYLLAQRPQASEPVAPVQFASSATKEPSGELVIDVIGKVKRPGIVTLPRGSRVHEAVAAAGGVRGKNVDTSSLNMARILDDGEQIVVGDEAAEAPGATSGKVNLNSASVDQLDTLPGVGPVTAQAIVAWRDEHGRFSSVDDLLDVRGIGDATLNELRDLVTV